ncbi:MAG: nuclear transport factor 2 family protein [Vicinamibacterales bacterium]
MLSSTRYQRREFLALAGGTAIAPLAVRRIRAHATSADDTRELTRLESVWNEAHVRGDVPALEGLCADDLVVTVPGMPVMSKDDILGFWRSGRAKITRHDTSEIRVKVYGDAAIVIGRLRRTRDFNGRVTDDDWRFTKTYTRRDNRWRVIAYHASPVAP